MGGVLIALIYLYVSAGVSLLGTWHTSRADIAKVRTLEREHSVLSHRRSALATQSLAETQARQLGMAHPGEKVYVLSGLPKH
jgi:cell division protein FtsB